MLSAWPKDRIDASCYTAYHRYEAEVRHHYEEYFSTKPELRSPHHPYSAESHDAALPPGQSTLVKLIPPGGLHTHSLSAKSSQMLALSLLGSAVLREPRLGWLWSVTGMSPAATGRQPLVRFEHRLSPQDLNEEPNTTQLDMSVETESCFVAVEAKWTERGFDTCSCLAGKEGTPAPGGFCAERVVKRRRYWAAAEEFLDLPYERLPLLPCPISPLYQVIRNVAAARQLAGPKRRFGFILLYDERNPYFSGERGWPGWSAVLSEQLRGRECRGFHFRAISWQSLVPLLPLDSSTRAWASEKHRLG